MDKEQQHVIPRGYLKSWACPNPPAGRSGMIWVVRKDNPEERALKSPKKYFREPDRYTLDTGDARNLAVENALSRCEAWFAQALSNIAGRKPLTGDDRVKLAFFAAAMMLRTHRIPTAVDRMLRTIQMQAHKQEGKANINHSFSDGISELLPSIVGKVVADGLPEMAFVLFRMNISLLVTDDDAGFVTGDEPCSVIVPGAWNACPTHPDVEIILPLSPQCAALYSWKVSRTFHATLDRKTVDRLNSRTVGQCTHEFVSWKGTVRPEWFLPDAA